MRRRRNVVLITRARRVLITLFLRPMYSGSCTTPSRLHTATASRSRVRLGRRVFNMNLCWPLFATSLATTVLATSANNLVGHCIIAASCCGRVDQVNSGAERGKPANVHQREAFRGFCRAMASRTALRSSIDDNPRLHAPLRQRTATHKGPLWVGTLISRILRLFAPSRRFVHSVW